MILGGGHLKKDTAKRILKKNTVVDIVKKRSGLLSGMRSI